MNTRLARLLYDYGMIHATLAFMEDAREKRSDSTRPALSEEQLRETPIGNDEPVLLVVGGTDNETSLSQPGSHDLQVLDPVTGVSHTKHVSVLKLPLEEFHFFSAFRPTLYSLSRELPAFIYGMTAVHAYGLFAAYFLESIADLLSRRPEMLGTSKQVDYGEILQCSTMDELKYRLAERFVHELGYKSCREQLEILRLRLGFRDLTNEFDDGLVEIALIRNCLVHNRGVVDSRLAQECPARFHLNTPIVADRELVDRTVRTARGFALAFGAMAEKVHLLT